MTTLEVKQQIDAMSDEERFLAAAYLEHRSNEKDPAHLRTLADRMDRMDAGQKVSIDQLDRLHRALENEGM